MTGKSDVLFVIICAMVVLSVPIIAKAVDVVAPTSGERAQATDSITQDFVRKAASGNLFEIESSKLAVKRSKDADVKKFAQQMINDHTRAGKEMKAAVAKGKIDPSIVPLVMDDKHANIIKDLEKASDANFNEDYIDAQEDAHDKTVSLFEDYSRHGDNMPLKEFAAKTLPSLREHLAHVEKLDDKE